MCVIWLFVGCDPTKISSNASSIQLKNFYGFVETLTFTNPCYAELLVRILNLHFDIEHTTPTNPSFLSSMINCSSVLPIFKLKSSKQIVKMSLFLQKISCGFQELLTLDLAATSQQNKEAHISLLNTVGKKIIDQFGLHAHHIENTNYKPLNFDFNSTSIYESYAALSRLIAILKKMQPEETLCMIIL